MASQLVPRTSHAVTYPPQRRRGRLRYGVAGAALGAGAATIALRRPSRSSGHRTVSGVATRTAQRGLGFAQRTFQLAKKLPFVYDRMDRALARAKPQGRLGRVVRRALKSPRIRNMIINAL